MNFNKMFLGGIFAALVVACGGNTAIDGKNGSSGSPGADGLPGVAGADGSSGNPGAQGSKGATGSPGAPGEAGAAGDQGEQGSQGDAGVSLCGDVQMPQWHMPCGGDLVNACADSNGEWECHLFLSEGQSGDVTQDLKIVCADSQTHTVLSVGSNQSSEYPQNPVSSVVSTTCNLTDCNGYTDTVGAGTNVVLVRPALTFLSPVQNSQDDAGGAQTWLPGLCRNATEHCLSSDTCFDLKVVNGFVQVNCDGFGNPEFVQTAGTDFEGVVPSDFGDLSTPTAAERLMGTECVDSVGSVRLYTCSTDVSGVASVTCTGPVQ